MTTLTLPVHTPEAEVERLGEALFILSDKLRSSGFFNSDSNHAAYERVVASFQATRTALAEVEILRGALRAVCETQWDMGQAEAALIAARTLARAALSRTREDK